jgi:hypothetical protein
MRGHFALTEADTMLDISKPVQTRDGRAVTNLTKVADRLVGAVACAKGLRIFNWKMDGAHNGEMRNSDLINVPAPPRFIWVNVYPDGSLGFEYKTRLESDFHSLGRLYVLRINIDTGETVKEPV